jgi:hypothetical protein
MEVLLSNCQRATTIQRTSRYENVFDLSASSPPAVLNLRSVVFVSTHSGFIGDLLIHNIVYLLSNNSVTTSRRAIENHRYPRFAGLHHQLNLPSPSCRPYHSKPNSRFGSSIKPARFLLGIAFLAAGCRRDLRHPQYPRPSFVADMLGR